MKPKNKTIKSGWQPGAPGEDSHYFYRCSDGDHNSFWKTVLESPQWEAWRAEQQRRFGLLTHDKLAPNLGVYDMPEVEECGWISNKHYAEFMEFAKTL